MPGIRLLHVHEELQRASPARCGGECSTRPIRLVSRSSPWRVTPALHGGREGRPREEGLVHAGEVLVQVGAGGVVPSVDAGGTVESRRHTLGHMSVQLASGSEQALVLGDAITPTLVSFAHPSGDPVTTEL